MSTQSTYGELFSTGPFRSLWFAQICSQLAINSLLFVLAIRLYQTTASNTAVSGLFLAYGIPAVLFGMIAGTAADHLDKRRVLMYCDLLRAILVFALFFVSGNFILVYVIMFINSVITQLYFPAEAPIIPRVVPQHLLVSANSLFAITFYSSLAVGSILAGPLLRIFGEQWIFILLGCLFIAAMWFESHIPTMAHGVLGFRTVLNFHISHIVHRIWEELRGGLSYVRRSAVLFDSLLLLTGTQIILMMLGTLGPGFADRSLGIDIRDVSILIVGPAVLGILIGAMWVGNVGYKFQNKTLINVGVLSAGVLLVSISFIASLRHNVFFVSYVPSLVFLGISILLFFLLGFANSLLDVPANSLLQQEANGDMRGRVYGMLTAAVGGVGILPVITGGVLADTVGVGKVIFLLGVVIVLYGLYRIRYNTK